MAVGPATANRFFALAAASGSRAANEASTKIQQVLTGHRSFPVTGMLGGGSQQVLNIHPRGMLKCPLNTGFLPNTGFDR